MAMAKPQPEPETYRGLPVLVLHAGDPIPTPRAPHRWAIQVHPDLARWWLTLNADNNRHVKPSRVTRYAADMAARLWQFIPQPIMFASSGMLIDGQHRLLAVAESGQSIWLVVEFGWPEDIVGAVDQGAVRTSGDALHMLTEAPSTNCLASTFALWRRWHTVRQANPLRQFSGVAGPSTQEAMLLYRTDAEAWDHSVRIGKNTYRALDKSLSPSTWSTAHRLISEVHGEASADAFMGEVCDGTGVARSATRTLADFYRRRPITATRTGDSREPIENIVRAWNAYKSGRTVSLVSRPGFALSPVK